jgi:hypothetical protein
LCNLEISNPKAKRIPLERLDTRESIQSNKRARLNSAENINLQLHYCRNLCSTLSIDNSGQNFSCFRSIQQDENHPFVNIPCCSVPLEKAIKALEIHEKVATMNTDLEIPHAIWSSTYTMIPEKVLLVQSIRAFDIERAANKEFGITNEYMEELLHDQLHLEKEFRCEENYLEFHPQITSTIRAETVNLMVSDTFIY